jgi:Ca2+-binding EF-hand superfamily protein
MAAPKSPRGFKMPPPNLSEPDRKVLQAAFNEIDMNKDGRIDEKELHSALKKTGLPFSKRVVHRMMLIHLQGTNDAKLNSLDFEQFVALSSFLNAMKHSFQSLDGDKNGSIDEKELGSGVIDLGLPVKREQIKLLMAIVDTDNNGTVDFAEYVDLTFYLIFFNHLAEVHRNKKIDEFTPLGLIDLCSIAGVEVTEEQAKDFIEKNQGKYATFHDLLGLLLVAQLRK